MDFKEIHIGQIINHIVTEFGIEISRICNFIKCTEKEIKEMYKSQSLDSEILLRWSKLLDYDLFRIYSQHLILFAPVSSKANRNQLKKISVPQFRKNLYTKEVIDFILEQLESGEMTKEQIIDRYRIPKTTLHKWSKKYLG